MKFEGEEYKLLLAWTVSFALLEPFVTLFEYFRQKIYGIENKYSQHKNSIAFFIVFSE